MSNELPQAPTEMCKPVITGSNYVGQKMSVKDLKLISKLYFGYYRVGRIKRMRSRREGRFVNLAKRVGKRAYSFSGDDYPYFIKRWNRH